VEFEVRAPKPEEQADSAGGKPPAAWEKLTEGGAKGRENQAKAAAKVAERAGKGGREASQGRIEGQGQGGRRAAQGQIEGRGQGRNWKAESRGPGESRHSSRHGRGLQ
jgi:hypothetical protein